MYFFFFLNFSCNSFWFLNFVNGIKMIRCSRCFRGGLALCNSFISENKEILYCN